MSFDRYTVGLLMRPAAAQPLTDEEADAVQDQHLNHLAILAEHGALVAAGPFRDQDDDSIRGIVIMNTTIEEARGLIGGDPSVRHGIIEYRFQTWLVPSGAVSFGKADFPRSQADAAARLERAG